MGNMLTSARDQDNPKARSWPNDDIIFEEDPYIVFRAHSHGLSIHPGLNSSMEHMVLTL
ncbi:hypothetical protein FS837_012803 [Tulasnella sp. UAMH 9824]|nr:hypothetical protein FS837_012803 [Tulasnella sp. UAMH 9824]